MTILRNNFRTAVVLLRPSFYCIYQPRCSYTFFSSNIKTDGFQKLYLVPGSNNVSYQTRRNVSFTGLSSYLTTDFLPINACVQILQYVHDIVGLPWWATIALTTFTMRTVITLPLLISSKKTSQRLQNLQPDIIAAAAMLRASTDMTMDKRKEIAFKNKMKQIRRELYIRDNCHPMKTILTPLTQLPFWILMSLALRNLAGFLSILGRDMPVLSPSLGTEGLLWFTNLLVPDSTLILPLILFTINTTATQLGFQKNITNLIDSNSSNKSSKSQPLKYFFHGINVVFFAISTQVPSCLCLYWTCSASHSLLQFMLLRTTTVSRLFGINGVATINRKNIPKEKKMAENKIKMDKNK